MKNFAGICLFVCLVSSPIIAQKVIIKTSLGNITIELYADKAPVTVANFLRYVDEKLYDGGTFYRVVRMDNQPQNPIKIEVIQGGLGDDTTKMLSPIQQETTQQTGIRHIDGTISMARTTPHTATSEFFICVNSHPELDFGGHRNPDGQGFAAFGQVVRGMKVVRKIQQGKTKLNPELGMNQTLVKPVIIKYIRRK